MVRTSVTLVFPSWRMDEGLHRQMPKQIVDVHVQLMLFEPALEDLGQEGVEVQGVEALT